MIATTSAMEEEPDRAKKIREHAAPRGRQLTGAPYMNRAAGVSKRSWMSDGPTRIERDSMGEMRVPADALWGASTQRAVENFPISGWRFPRVFIRALGLIKHAAARANEDLGLLDPGCGAAIRADAAE